MGSMSKAMICMVLILAVLLLGNSVPSADAVVGCGQVISNLSRCLNYVQDKGPIGQCCSGVKTLYTAAGTTADRRSVCTCLKNIIGAYSQTINYGKAAGLPSQCGVHIPYKIAPSTNCNSVN